MSLINQLLKDLEKNQRRATTPASLLAGLHTEVAFELRKRKKYYVSIIVLLLVLMTLIGSRFHSWYQPHVAAGKAAPAPVQTTVTQAASARPATMDSALLTGITMQLQQDMTYLRFLLNHNTLYEVTADMTRHELTLVFEDTHLEAALPKMNYAGSGIQSIQAYKDENHNLKLVLRLNPTAEIKRLEQSGDGLPSELQLDIQYNNAFDTIDNHPEAQTTIPVTIKKPAVESIAEQGYQQAVELTDTGDQTQAAQILRQVLQAAPDNEKSREYLVSLLTQLGKKTEAMRVVDAGLAINPKAFALIKQKARLLVDEGKVEAALKILEYASPELAKDPEYFAFIAALYQRQGKTVLAETLYKKLLALQPANPKWWVGLGIALETRGDASQAYDAYTNADNIGGLDPELKSYLNMRLHTT